MALLGSCMLDRYTSRPQETLRCRKMPSPDPTVKSPHLVTIIAHPSFTLIEADFRLLLWINISTNRELEHRTTKSTSNYFPIKSKCLPFKMAREDNSLLCTNRTVLRKCVETYCHRYTLNAAFDGVRSDQATPEPFNQT